MPWVKMDSKATLKQLNLFLKRGNQVLRASRDNILDSMGYLRETSENMRDFSSGSGGPIASVTGRGPGLMIRRFLSLFLASLVLFSLASCLSGPKRSYYTLTYPMPEPLVDTPHPYTIRVKEVVLKESYSRSEVVLRPDQFEIQYDRRRRWSERPQKMISGLIVDHLRASNIAQRVLDRAGGGLADFTLQVGVDVIEQAQSGSQLFARLKTTWTLIRNEDDQVVWMWRDKGKKPVGTSETSSMRATVRELVAYRRNRRRPLGVCLYEESKQPGYNHWLPPKKLKSQRTTPRSSIGIHKARTRTAGAFSRRHIVELISVPFFCLRCRISLVLANHQFRV